MLSTLFASLSTKIAGVALAATVATAGALAATGSLPASAQQAAVTVAAKVGIALPDPGNHAGSDSNGTDADHGFPAVTPTVTPSVTPTAIPKDRDIDPPTATVRTDIDTPTATVGTEVNHGACVSFAAHLAASLGLDGSEHGGFVSMIARDPDARSAKVSDAGVPDAACLAAIAKAKLALSAGRDPDPDAPTSTVTPAPTGDGNDHGDGNGHPTGNGNDNAPHPTGKPDSVPTVTHPGHS